MKTKDRHILVIARKYNDIFYAQSIPEWKSSACKILFIISDKLSYEKFPMQEVFDEIHFVHQKEGGWGLFFTILEVKSAIKKLEYDTVVLSNISIVANKLIICSKKCEQAILLEDGLMNYYEFKEQNYFMKRVAMFLMGIKQKKVYSKVIKTYLLKPSEAQYSFGILKQLVLDTKHFDSICKDMPSIQDKKLFIGQPLYHSYTGNNLSLNEYNKLVNEAIVKFAIDYYVPHTMADKHEDINCPIFNIGDYSITFEVLASLFDLELYSFSSTVLYSTKIINPNVKCVMLVNPKIKRLSSDSILYKHIDKIIEL